MHPVVLEKPFRSHEADAATGVERNARIAAIDDRADQCSQCQATTHKNRRKCCSEHLCLSGIKTNTKGNEDEDLAQHELHHSHLPDRAVSRIDRTSRNHSGREEGIPKAQAEKVASNNRTNDLCGNVEDSSGQCAESHEESSHGDRGVEMSARCWSS